MLVAGESPADCARFCIDAVAATMDRMIEDCTGNDRETPFVFTGGVMSNTLLREHYKQRAKAVFAEAGLSGDNAVGTAVLASLGTNGLTGETV
jgi:N6-L-threonylcarbamoyladenine synthase